MIPYSCFNGHFPRRLINEPETYSYRVTRQQFFNAIRPLEHDKIFWVRDNSLPPQLLELLASLKSIGINVYEPFELFIFKRIYFLKYEGGTRHRFFYSEHESHLFYKCGLPGPKFAVERNEGCLFSGLKCGNKIMRQIPKFFEAPG